MSKHTQGPWRISLGQLHGEGTRIGSIDDAETNAGLTDEEALANAALITAAPELLEALISLVQYESSFSHDRHGHKKLEAARRAINKATGVTP